MEAGIAKQMQFLVSFCQISFYKSPKFSPDEGVAVASDGVALALSSSLLGPPLATYPVAIHSN